MHDSYIKLAKIFRTKPEMLVDFAAKMEKLTGKKEVIENLMEENEILVRRTLEELGLDRQKATAEEVYSILIKRLTHLDEHLYQFLDKPDLSKMSHVCGKLCQTAIELAKPQKGFFVKQERAVAMLEKFPPQNLLDHFGYKTVAELVEKQGFSSVFASLRFAQDEKWMHVFFDKGYADLTADDFEERDVELKVLEEEWLDVADKFMKKKHHNVSHLKELGIIFIVPIKIDIPGETARMFMLLLHYLNEVPFYTKLIRQYSQESDFVPKLQSMLRGDVPEGPAPEGSFRIVQRYLAKDDENDFRLLEPHVNPEAEHWYKAEGDLGRLAMHGDAAGHTLGYWQGLDFVGDFFPTLDGKEELISFDLIDLIMSVVKKGESKYLYHQEEALWNKLFIEYIGRGRLETEIEKNIINGFITL
ncbi:MAG: hypothetical protein AAB420_03210 [Patescibacteria group bacterium]